MILPTHFVITLIGLLVGTLVTMTGLGGGVVLLPLLMLGVGVPPVTAVGSSAVFMFFTKIGAATLHWRRGNVDWRLAVAMSVGSLPGALLGVALLAYSRSRYGGAINGWLRTVVGAVLLGICVITALQDLFLARRSSSLPQHPPPFANRYHGALLTGALGGLLAGATSVGSGSVIMILLLLFYSLPAEVLVGTDICHAVFLTGVISIGQFEIGTVDPKLVGLLLLGSLPGVVFGAVLTSRIPSVWIRRLVLLVVACVGFEMM